MGNLYADGKEEVTNYVSDLKKREAAAEGTRPAAATDAAVAAASSTKPPVTINSADRIAAEEHARLAAEKAAATDPAARKAQLEALGDKRTDQERLDLMNLYRAEAEAKAKHGDPQASVGPGYRNVYRAPNGVMHDIYGSDGVAEAQKFHGGPGVPIDANHPALKGQVLPDGVQLVEYRTPARDASLQARIQARMQGAA